MQAHFSAAVENISVHDFLKKYESSIHWENEISFSYADKKCFFGFITEFPGKETAIH